MRYGAIGTVGSEGQVCSHASQDGACRQRGVAATTVVVAVHLDATIRRAIRFPEDMRQRAIEIKKRETTALQEICG